MGKNRSRKLRHVFPIYVRSGKELLGFPFKSWMVDKSNVYYKCIDIRRFKNFQNDGKVKTVLFQRVEVILPDLYSMSPLEIEEMGTMPDFEGVDLSMYFLSSATFNRVNLKGANLMGAYLCGAEIQWSILENADLSSANLKRALLLGREEFKNINLSGANLSGANLSGSDLSSSDLSNANFSNARLLKVKFGKDTVLSNVNFSGANLKGAEFLGATLPNVNFSGANLKGAEFLGATLPNVNFSGADLENSKFIESTLSKKTKFLDAKLISTSFKNSKIEDADFREANIEEASFIGTKIQKTDFRKAKLWRENEKLYSADFGNSELDSINFEDIDLMKANFDEAKLIKVRIKEADFRGVNLSKTKIIKTKIWEANLEGTEIDFSSKIKIFTNRLFSTPEGVVGICGLGLSLVLLYNSIFNHPPSLVGEKYPSTYNLIQSTYQKIEEGVFENWFETMKNIQDKKMCEPTHNLIVDRSGNILSNAPISLSDRKKFGRKGYNITLNDETKYPFIFNCDYNLEEKINSIKEKNINTHFGKIKIENGSLEDVIRKVVNTKRGDFENLFGFLAVEKDVKKKFEINILEYLTSKREENGEENLFNLDDLDLKNCEVSSKNYQNQIAQTFCAYDVFENNKRKIYKILEQKEEMKNYKGSFENVAENLSILAFKIGIDTTCKIIGSKHFNYFVSENFNADDLVMATTISNFGRGSGNFKIGLDDIKYLAEVEVVKGKI